MTSVQRVAVVTDTCSSIRPDDELAQEHEVVVIPVDVKFFEGGRYVSYSDVDITPQEFYERMRASEKLPQTSGAITGRIVKAFERLSRETRSIISIHVTSKHSVAWESAVLGKKLTQEKMDG